MELSIEAASDDVGIALSVDGVVGLSATWHTERNHSVELLPNIDRLLTEAGRTKADLSAIFIDLGPGGYAGLRVSVSIAKALSHALAIPIVGVGRLEVDAWLVAADVGVGARVVAVHRAGRGELAWASYRGSDGDWGEEAAPRIAKSEAMQATLITGDAVTGDIDDELADAIQRAGARAVSSHHHRVVALAVLAHRRLQAGRADDATALVPMYLRAPAVGPQRP